VIARVFRRRPGGGRSRGQSLVETALILPVFLLLLMLLFDFGRVIYAQNTITADAREGVRRGIVSATALSSSADFQTRFQAIRAAARAMSPAVPITDDSVIGGGGGCNAVNALTGGTPVMPADSNTTGRAYCFYPNGVMNTTASNPPKVVVQIRVRVNFITPIINNILGGGMDLSAKAEQLIQS
jgi:Flp pilus assembly protein TadG